MRREGRSDWRGVEKIRQVLRLVRKGSTRLTLSFAVAPLPAVVLCSATFLSVTFLSFPLVEFSLELFCFPCREYWKRLFCRSCQSLNRDNRSPLLMAFCHEPSTEPSVKAERKIESLKFVLKPPEQRQTNPLSLEPPGKQKRTVLKSMGWNPNIVKTKPKQRQR